MSINQVFIDSQWLSNRLVDYLDSEKKDWICWLKPNQEIELYDFSVLGNQSFRQESKYFVSTVSNLIALVREGYCTSINVSEYPFWTYSCCIQTIGWGRLRLVVCIKGDLKTGSSNAFITNRLDWSPCNILSCWDKKFSIFKCFENDNNLSSAHRQASQLVALR